MECQFYEDVQSCQAWGQVHFKLLKYKYFETFTSTSTTSYLQEVLKYNTSTF